MELTPVLEGLDTDFVITAICGKLRMFCLMCGLLIATPTLTPPAFSSIEGPDGVPPLPPFSSRAAPHSKALPQNHYATRARTLLRLAMMNWVVFACERVRVERLDCGDGCVEHGFLSSRMKGTLQKLRYRTIKV